MWATRAISGGELRDGEDPNLVPDVTIEFIGSNQYEVDDGTTTTTITLPANNTIELDSYRVQITGDPAVGDTFTVGPNSAGVGDNRNAQALLGLREAGVLEGGQRSLLQQSDTLLARVGGATAAAQTALESQTALLRNSEASLESVRGVNLEEEAANLLRFQQAFQANARVIQTANTTFQSLLAAFR